MLLTYLQVVLEAGEETEAFGKLGRVGGRKATQLVKDRAAPGEHFPGG